jgi:hypothetical protein
MLPVKSSKPHGLLAHIRRPPSPIDSHPPKRARTLETIVIDDD